MRSNDAEALYYDKRKEMHCLKNLVGITGDGQCKYAYSGSYGSKNEWKIFKNTRLYKYPERYFEFNDKHVLLFDKGFSAYSWNDRIVSPYNVG